jgi:hypothetical protein
VGEHRVQEVQRRALARACGRMPCTKRIDGRLAVELRVGEALGEARPRSRPLRRGRGQRLVRHRVGLAEALPSGR